MEKLVNFLYKHAHYTVCLLTVVLTLATFGTFQLFVSRQTFVYWNPDTSVLWRFFLDCCLLLLFIFQHSFMATEWLKRQLSNWLLITVSERIIYVISTCLCLMFLQAQWQSIPETYLWLIDTQRRDILWLLFLITHVVCWLMLSLEIFLMDPAEMVGIAQVQNYHNSRKPPLLEKVKKLRGIYSRMRHPGALLLTLMLWVHPLMTLDHLLLASVLTTYMIGRHSFEDKHYTFAEKYFTETYTQKVTKSSVRYEYVQEN